VDLKISFEEAMTEEKKVEKDPKSKYEHRKILVGVFVWEY